VPPGQPGSATNPAPAASSAQGGGNAGTNATADAGAKTDAQKTDAQKTDAQKTDTPKTDAQNTGSAPAGNQQSATADADDTAAKPHADTAQIVVDAKGTYANQPVTGRLIGGALLSLRDASQPYPIDLSVANGPTHVSLVGTVSDPLHFKGTDLQLDFAGPDMSLLFPLTGIPIPKTPAYHITGRLDYANQRFRFENFAGTVGNSDLEGTITEDPGKERPDVTADLASRRVDLADLGGFIGTEPGRAGEANASPQQRQQTAKAEASPRLLPQQPLNLPKIRAADIHLRYKGEHIEGRSIPFDNIVVALDIVDGRIQLHPVSFAVGTGAISADVDLAPVGNDIRAKAGIKFQRVDVSRLMAATHAFGGAGTIGGQANIDTTGNSVATMLGNGNGGLDLSMAGGDLSALLVDLSGFQFGNALLSALGIPQRAQVQCFVAQFALTRGLLQTRALILDTGEGIINGTGDINLRDEAIDYRLKTDAKHFTIGSLPAPIHIGGTFKNPSVMPDVAALGVRGGLAAGLGILAPPLALLPTIQFGVGNDNRCARLASAPPSTAPAANAPATRRPAQRRR
jgi:AsmA family protein